jgi:hypothetical protein
VHVGALWNRFAMDDLYIIVWNPLVHSAGGIWRAFVAPYWPPDLGGKLYRPLAVASYTLDGLVDDAPWFHAVNLPLARRRGGGRGRWRRSWPD